MGHFHLCAYLHKQHVLMIIIRSQECRLRCLSSSSDNMGRGPINANSANINPTLKIRLKVMMVQIRIPSSVKSHVRHANRNILPPMVDIALWINTFESITKSKHMNLIVRVYHSSESSPLLKYCDSH